MLKKLIIPLVLSGTFIFGGICSVCAEESYSENCEELNLQEYTSDTANINLGNGWHTNGAMAGGTASCAVEADVLGADGKCFRLGSKANSGDYDNYPGIILSGTSAKSGENQQISFRFSATSVNAEVGIRFLKNDEGCYELILPKKGDTLAYLNKITGGSRVCMAKIPGISARSRKTWYSVSLTVSAAGTIEWTVTDSGGNTLLPDASGSAADSIPFKRGQDSDIELIAGGYGTGYVYFDDILYSSEDYEYKFTENFDALEKVSYSAVFDGDVPEDNTVVESKGKRMSDMWITNDVMGYDGRAYAGIIEGGAGSDGQCLAISARAEWQQYWVYPGVILNLPECVRAADRVISFNFRAADGLYGGGGAGIRFMIEGNSFYELVFPRLDSGYRTVFNKVKDGARKTVFTLPAADGCRKPNLWYRAEIRCSTDGHISWTVRRCDGVSTDADISMDGEFYDESYVLPESDKIELIAGGYRCAVSYFDDITIKYVEPQSGSLVKHERFTDDFETDNTEASGIISALNTRWRFWSGNAGYDNKAKAGIGNKYNSVGMTGKYLAVEARATDLIYWEIPTVIYTGEYPESRGISVGVDIKTASGGYGAGIRFMISDDERSYYELYFPSGRYNDEYVTAVINKVTPEGRTELYKTTGKSAADCIQGDTLYRLSLKVCGGKISYSLLGREGDFGSSGEVDDYCNPHENGRLGFMASGGNGNYVGYDNFVITAYDPFVDDKAEPDNVIYKNVSKKAVRKGDVIDLGAEYPIRKITAEKETEVRVSHDAVSFIPIGTVKNGKLINTLTNLPYRYVKLSAPGEASVWTDIVQTELIRENSCIEISARVNGEDNAAEIRSSSADISTENGMLTALRPHDGYIHISASYGDCVTEMLARVISPLDVTIDADTLTGRITTDESLPEAVAVIRYIDSENRILKTIYSPTYVLDNMLTFTGEYCPGASEISVVLRNKNDLLSTLMREFSIK